MPPKRGRFLQSPNPIEGNVIDGTDADPSSAEQPENCSDNETTTISISRPALQRQRSTVPTDSDVSEVKTLDRSAIGRSADVADPVSPVKINVDRAKDGSAVAEVASPGRNRAAFHLQHSPSRLTCNLELSRIPIGSKVTLVAVVIAAFPAYTNPDRRYVQLADATGSVGITVWNHNVARFNREAIGQVVNCGKVVLSSHQGKKVLTMTRESTMEFQNDPTLNSWWNSLALDTPLKLSSVADIDDNAIVNVSGILGMVSSEKKIVGSVERTLTTLHITDPYGQLDIRTWNHERDAFVAYVDKPIMITRIRMASFAGQKIGELLDNSASTIVTSFPGMKALTAYWDE